MAFSSNGEKEWGTDSSDLEKKEKTAARLRASKLKKEGEEKRNANILPIVGEGEKKKARTWLSAVLPGKKIGRMNGGGGKKKGGGTNVLTAMKIEKGGGEKKTKPSAFVFLRPGQCRKGGRRGERGGKEKGEKSCISTHQVRGEEKAQLWPRGVLGDGGREKKRAQDLFCWGKGGWKKKKKLPDDEEE